MMYYSLYAKLTECISNHHRVLGLVLKGPGKTLTQIMQIQVYTNENHS